METDLRINGWMDGWIDGIHECRKTGRNALKQARCQTCILTSGKPVEKPLNTIARLKRQVRGENAAVREREVGSAFALEKECLALQMVTVGRS